MCDWHRSQWRNLYHGCLQQLSPMTWGYQQQNPFSSYFENSGQCRCCAAHVPTPCCSAPTWPVRTCYLYRQQKPNHCCTNPPLPVRGCTSRLRHYQNRYCLIHPHSLNEYTYGLKKAEKLESSSDDEDYSEISDKNTRTKRMLNRKHTLAKERPYSSPVYNNYLDLISDISDASSDETEDSSMRYPVSRKIERETGIAIKYSRNSQTMLQNLAYFIKKREEADIERAKEDKGITFKIIEEPCQEINFDDSDDNSSDEDEDGDFSDDSTAESDYDYESEDESDDEDEAEYDYESEDESDDEDEDDEDWSDDEEDVPDIQSTENKRLPRYGSHLEMNAYGELQMVHGRITPTTLEDDIVQQKLRKCVYGDKAEAICAQETLMINKYDQLMGMAIPKLWPVHPIPL